MASRQIDYAIGFQSQLEEFQGVQASVKGVIPAWLNGVLVRNCPAKYEVGIEKYRHWFDGLAKLSKIEISNGQATFTSKFLKTKAYLDSSEQNRMVYSEFATNPHRTFFDKLKIILKPGLTDNANVNVASVNDCYLAFTETVKPTQFSLATLNTIDEFSYMDKLYGQVSTAHPHYDFKRQELYNLLVSMGPKSTYTLYRIGQGFERKPIVVMPVDKPAYHHSFSISQKYVTLVESPLVANPIDLALGIKTYIDCYKWSTKRGTIFRVFDRDNGELVLSAETDPIFCFHHVNSFEKDGQLIVDLLAYADSQIINQLYLDNLRSGGPMQLCKLRRFCISLKDKTIKSEILLGDDLELPRINYQSVNGTDYSYLYACGQSQDAFLNRLVKADLVNNTTKTWQEDGCYPGEPVFVARPGAEKEDDGLILSLVLDTRIEKSQLVIFDAQSLHECARVNLPALIPFGFHGQFFTS